MPDRLDRRGVNRAVYSALVDDPDFQCLSSPARLVLLTARLSKQAGPGCIFRYYPEILLRQTGLSAMALTRAVADLQGAGWIECDAVVFWIRNGLRYDPTLRLADRKHRLAVERTLADLPKSEVVVNF